MITITFIILNNLHTFPEQKSEHLIKQVFLAFSMNIIIYKQTHL